MYKRAFFRRSLLLEPVILKALCAVASHNCAVKVQLVIAGVCYYPLVALSCVAAPVVVSLRQSSREMPRIVIPLPQIVQQMKTQVADSIWLEHAVLRVVCLLAGETQAPE